MRDLLLDVRYAARQLWHTPGFTLTAVLTLALGIGATTTLFAVVNGAIFRLTDGFSVERVTRPGLMDGLGTHYALAAPVARLREIERAHSPAIVGVAGVSRQSLAVRRPGRVETLSAELVSGDYATVFEIRPAAGRWLTAEDDRDAAPVPVAVISHRIWREWFGARPEAVGSATIRIGRQDFTVIGVAEPAFNGLSGFFVRTDVWLPLASRVRPGDAGQQAPSRVEVFVRWQRAVPPVDVAHALLEPMVSDATTAHLEQLRQSTVRWGLPLDERRTRIRFELVQAGEALYITWAVQRGLAFLAIAALVLVAASANFANLLNARGTQRTGELAVRMSLGAGRGRILRLLTAESLLIAGAASGLGLLIAAAATRAFQAMFPALAILGGREMAIGDLALDGRVIAFSLGAGLLATAGVGTVAAWRASRAPLQSVVSAGGAAPGQTPGRGRWLRTTLVAVQVTVAVVLALASATFIEDVLYRLEQQGLRGRVVHYDTSRVVAGQVALPRDLGADYNEPRGRQFFDRILPALARLPDVEAAGLADAIPGALGPAAPASDFLELADTPEGLAGFRQRAVTSYVRVSPGFLRVLDLPVLAGRDLRATDAYGAPLVAVITESAAEAAWPGQDPIGRQIQRRRGPPITIVGVTADPVTSADDSPWRRPSNVVYLPLAQSFTGRAYLVVRSSAPERQPDAMRAAVVAMDDRLALDEPATVASGALSRDTALRALMAVVTGLGAIALAIAMVGVYGVIAFFVSRRTREIGIRAALGATPRQILRMVIDEALHIVLVGLLCGVFVAAMVLRAVLAARAGIHPGGATSWIVVPVLLLACGILAGYLPARRAARIDPNVALREL
ncbi:MAG: ABC transporter permease [Vicinamibacterales bacterium]